jgi:hypothetical protein
MGDKKNNNKINKLKHVNGKETKKTIQCDNEKEENKNKKTRRICMVVRWGFGRERGLVGTGAGIVVVKRSAVGRRAVVAVARLDHTNTQCMGSECVLNFFK